MSFSTSNGDPLAIVVGGKSKGEIIFLQSEERKDTTVKAKPVRDIQVGDGVFEQIPDPDHIRILYIAGPSGSGKSTYAASYIKKYLKLYPGCGFYVFSRVADDEVIDKLKPHRIVIDEEMIHDPIQLEDVEENSIVLFDDIDTISNKKLQDSVNNIKKQILEMGRHTNIQCVITSHLINGNDKGTTRTVLNEMQSFTFFPSSGSTYQIKYCLKQYFGLSGTQIAKVLALPSRAVTIRKIYPQVVISEHQCIFINVL